MKYSKFARVAMLLPVALLGFACVDLTLEPHDGVSENAYFRSMGDFRGAIIGIYDQMQSADWYGCSLPLIADIMGEDVKPIGWSSHYGYRPIADFFGWEMMFGTRLWAEVYEGINMANMMINSAFEPPRPVPKLSRRASSRVAAG